MSTTKILVADDSRSIRTLLHQLLSEAGYDVQVVEDGQQAVAAAVAECPDLVVLDIQMPHKDGYATCQELLSLGEPWCSVPFVFLSKMRVGALQLLGEELGAYLPKPVKPSALLETVARLLQAKRMAVASESSAVANGCLSRD